MDEQKVLATLTDDEVKEIDAICARGDLLQQKKEELDLQKMDCDLRAKRWWFKINKKYPAVRDVEHQHRVGSHIYEKTSDVSK